MTTPFHLVAPGPAGHFRLHFFGAVLHLLERLRQVEEPDRLLERFPFLKGYLEQLRAYLPEGATWSHSARWWEASLSEWEAANEGHLPLRALTLEYPARLALLTVGLVEEDSRFGTLFAWLQQPQGQRRPTVELLERLLGADTRKLLAAGLMAVADRAVPRAEWELYVPEPIWEPVQGAELPVGLPWRRSATVESVDLILPPDLTRQLSALPPLLERGQVRAVVVRGARGSQRLEVAGAAFRAPGRSLLVVEGAPAGHLAPLGPICTMTRSVPVLTFDLAPGETATLPDLPGYDGPIGVLMSLEGGLRGAAVETAVTLTLPLPTAAERRLMWHRALRGHPCPDLEAIAARFHLPGDYIRQAGSLAANRAALDGREAVTLHDVAEACRMLNRQMLDTLATRLEPSGTWEQLVVSEAAMTRLQELEGRCRHREELLDHVSPVIGRSGNRGVRALFGGPSGTGKTMAARTLAAVLGMDIYRVDLAAVVNKYIGETEKNLHQVLSRAEELDVILLLDEGDALLARRSEVKSSNDRYANLETNYLLQRLEHYQGIVLVTTNAAELIDPAFRRRMDVVINFLPPQAAERARIWRLHLPPGHGVDPAYVDEVAARCGMTGGQIRNAAVLATLLALESGGPVTRRHLDEAIRGEYRKAGAVSPLVEQTGAQPRRRRMEAFLDTMREQP